MLNYFYFAGKSIADFGAYITDAGVYERPDRNFEKVAVAGRNGDLLIENDNFPNVRHTYPVIIMENFDENYDALMSFLLTQRGYQKLSDSFHPDEYYMATFVGVENLTHTIEPKSGKFNLVFDRKPQRFLTSGDIKTRIVKRNDSIKNPTRFDALPLLKVNGIGKFIINDIAVKVLKSPTGFVNPLLYVDCDMQEAYFSGVNCNDCIELVNGVFPKLKSGNNDIELWSFSYMGNAAPTLNNYPAVNWNTDAKKAENINSTYLDRVTNKAYKFLRKGVVVKFDDQCDTEKGYDYVQLYYQDPVSGQWNESEKLGGRAGSSSNNLAGREIFIPSMEFYLKWHTDASQHGFWGYKVASVVAVGGTRNDFSYCADPHFDSYITVNVGTDALPQSEHPYTQDNITEIYKVIASTDVLYDWVLSTWDDCLHQYANAYTLDSVEIMPRWWKL